MTGWYWVGGVVGGVLLLVLLICWARIVITCTYRHIAEDDLLQLKVRVWGITVYKFETTMIDWNVANQAVTFKEKSEALVAEEEQKKKWTWRTLRTFWRESQKVLHQVVGLHKILTSFLAHVTIHSFSWRTKLGTGDAANAARIAGVLWAVKGGLSGFLSTKLKWKQAPELNVVPHYQAAGLSVSFSCIVSFRLGHAIRTGIRLLRSRKSDVRSFSKREKQLYRKSNRRSSEVS